MTTRLFASLLALLLAAPALASDPAELKKNALASLTKARKALEADDLSEAMTEGDWALQYMRQLDSAQGASQFPKDVMGLALQNVETQDAMGITNIEATYGGGKDRVTVTITQMGGAGSPLGGLGAFAQLGLAAQPNKFRAGPFTAGQPQPMEANLQSPKGMVVFKANKRAGPDLQKWVQSFVESTKDYLSGQ